MGYDLERRVEDYQRTTEKLVTEVRECFNKNKERTGEAKEQEVLLFLACILTFIRAVMPPEMRKMFMEMARKMEDEKISNNTY